MAVALGGAPGAFWSSATQPGICTQATPTGTPRTLPCFPCRTKMGGPLAKSLGKPAAHFPDREPFLGEHLCPAALGMVGSRSVCRAVRDPVCLNCNLGLWPESLAVCFTNSHLQSQIRLIKKPAPNGAINVTWTSGE